MSPCANRATSLDCKTNKVNAPVSTSGIPVYILYILYLQVNYCIYR